MGSRESESESNSRVKCVQWSYHDGFNEGTVSQKLLWHGDSSETQKKMNFCRRKPVPEDWRRPAD
jgi:hypothetical protein